MKKNTTPKSGQLLLGLTVIALLLTSSCKKELVQIDNPDNPQKVEGTKLAALKKSYVQNENIVVDDRNWLNSLSPNWSKVRELKDKKGIIYEIELNNPQGIFATDGNVNLKDAKKKYAKKSIIRLLIFKGEMGQGDRSCFMEVIATGENVLPSQLSYKNYGNLSGLVSFYELDGKLANGWVYSNGKAVMSTSASTVLTGRLNASKRGGANGRIMFDDGPPEGYIDCGNRFVPHMRTVCTEVGGLESPGYDGGGEGSGKICREEMYFVSERIYCPIVGGGSGGGEYDPPPNPSGPGAGGTPNPTAPKPCDEADKLEKHSKFKDMMVALQTLTAEDREYGAMITFGENGAMSKVMLEGKPGAAMIDFNLPSNPIDGIAHSHYKNLLSVFSPADLMAMASTYSLGKMRDPKTFSHTLATANGTQYMMIIEDQTAFATFAKNLVENNTLDIFETLFKNTFHIEPTNTNDVNEKNFLNYLRLAKSGLKLFKGNKSFTDWVPIKFENNEIVNNPCN